MGLYECFMIFEALFIDETETFLLFEIRTVEYYIMSAFFRYKMMKYPQLIIILSIEFVLSIQFTNPNLGLLPKSGTMCLANSQNLERPGFYKYHFEDMS